jgi:hypothetical protein
MIKDIVLEMSIDAREYRITTVVTDIQDLTVPHNKPPVVLQNDPRYAGWIYAPNGTLTMAEAGCLVCSYTSLIAWAGLEDPDPVKVANTIGKAGAFSGNDLGYPARVSQVYPDVVWHGRGDRVYFSPLYDEAETSLIHWMDRPADVLLLSELLHTMPVVVKLDYFPTTPKVDSHFVLAYKYVPDPNGGLNDDLLIMDPMGGLSSILTYFNPLWMNTWMQQNKVTKVARTLVGARVWEV